MDSRYTSVGIQHDQRQRQYKVARLNINRSSGGRLQRERRRARLRHGAVQQPAVRRRAFTSMNGVTRFGLAELSPTTGAVRSGVNVPFTGTHNGGSTQIREIAVTPGADRMVATAISPPSAGTPATSRGPQHLRHDRGRRHWATSPFAATATTSRITRTTSTSLPTAATSSSAPQEPPPPRAAVRHHRPVGDVRDRHRAAAELGGLHRGRHDVLGRDHRHRGLRRRPPAVAEQPVWTTSRPGRRRGPASGRSTRSTACR